MPFRATFDCLWCGRHHETRTPHDLEGWASLCPECVGRADENGFLRARVRAGLRERAGATTAQVEAPQPTERRPDGRVRTALPAARASPGHADALAPPRPVHDDWYLRRGPFSRGPIVDQPWVMELDEATRWVDEAPLSGVIVELGAGSGWWSTLLAGKGELWAFEPDDAALDAARQRLMAHGLRAHLHLREPTAAADREADALFAAYHLGAAPDDARLRERLEVARGWLKPGAAFAFVEAQPSASDPRPVDGPAGPLWPRDAGTLRAALERSGLTVAELRTTARSFILGLARRPS